VGPTLFLAPDVVGEASFTRLAASVQGQPFAWVDPHALYPGGAPDSAISALLAMRSTLAVSFVSDPSCRPGCDRVMAIGRDGASWSLATPAFAGHPVQLLAASGDGTILFGQTVQDAAASAGSRAYFRSTDSGATWQALPSLPRGLIALTMLAAPDGTLFAELYSSDGPVGTTTTRGIYKLAPLATAWTYRAPYPEDAGGPVAVAWDARGHPLALWGEAIQQSTQGGVEVRIGLEYHTP
jgi:hypothetical protein